MFLWDKEVALMDQQVASFFIKEVHSVLKQQMTAVQHVVDCSAEALAGAVTLRYALGFVPPVYHRIIKTR